MSAGTTSGSPASEAVAIVEGILDLNMGKVRMREMRIRPSDRGRISISPLLRESLTGRSCQRAGHGITFLSGARSTALTAQRTQYNRDMRRLHGSCPLAVMPARSSVGGLSTYRRTRQTPSMLNSSFRRVPARIRKLHWPKVCARASALSPHIGVVPSFLKHCPWHYVRSAARRCEVPELHKREIVSQ